MRLVVIGHGISPLGTMGGNSKIILEVLKNLPDSFSALVVTFKPETFEANCAVGGNIVLAPIPKPAHDDILHMAQTSRHTLRHTRKVFQEHGVGKNDIVYCVSDFPPDVLPGVVLKREFGYRWIPSLYLFVPSPWRNLRGRYGFPFFKYVLYYAEQRLLFAWMKRSADGFVVTNDGDRSHFPKSFHDRILAIYGGVNTEQIEAAFTGPLPEKRYDAVFCSRLHPQKGVGGLLDIWRLVMDRIPQARLAIIGNGDPAYEAFLRNKAERLGLAGNIDWLGYVNNVEKYRVYRASKMLLHTTVYDNNGMVAAEALCSGLPVVMFDLPMLRDLYTDGCTKVPKGDHAAFAEAIVSLLQNADRFDASRPMSTQIAELQRRWNWRKRTELFVEFVEQLFESHGLIESISAH